MFRKKGPQNTTSSILMVMDGDTISLHAKLAPGKGEQEARNLAIAAHALCMGRLRHLVRGSFSFLLEGGDTAQDLFDALTASYVEEPLVPPSQALRKEEE